MKPALFEKNLCVRYPFYFITAQKKLEKSCWYITAINLPVYNMTDRILREIPMRLRFVYECAQYPQEKSYVSILSCIMA